MIVRTGYYAMMSEYEEAGFTCISIASSNKILTEHRLRELNPPWDIIHTGLSQQEYTIEYLWRILKPLDCKEIWRKLEAISDKIILLCFEKPDDFCHRHLVAAYFTSKGFPIEEYKLLGEVSEPEDRNVPNP